MAILGAATLAIGLALQDSINNLASGISTIMLRPFVVGDCYSDDILKAKRIVAEILAAEERITKELAPTVFVKELGNNSVDLIAWPHVEGADELRVSYAVTEQVKLRFDVEGIKIPFQQRDVHLYRPD